MVRNLSEKNKKFTRARAPNSKTEPTPTHRSPPAPLKVPGLSNNLIQNKKLPGPATLILSRRGVCRNRVHPAHLAEIRTNLAPSPRGQDGALLHLFLLTFLPEPNV